MRGHELGREGPLGQSCSVIRGTFLRNSWRVGWLVPAILLVAALSGSVASAASTPRPKISGATEQVPAGQVAAIHVDVGASRACRADAIHPATRRRQSFGFTTSRPLVTLRWRVPSKTRRGIWRVRITCGLSARALRGGTSKSTNVIIRVTSSSSGRAVIFPIRGGVAATSRNRPPTGAGPVVLGGGGDHVDGLGKGAVNGGYAFGHCTYYAWLRRPEVTNLGNAGDWFANAQARGIPTDGGAKRPVAGAIAWWRTGHPYTYFTEAGRRVSYGHVAYVESVQGSTILISEMNAGDNTRRDRRMNINDPWAPDGYIYGGPAGSGGAGGQATNGRTLHLVTNDGVGTGVSTFASTGSAFVGTHNVGLASYGWAGTKPVAGDFTGDGLNDVALLTDQGPGGTGLLTMSATGSTLNGPSPWANLALYGWAGIKPVAGDFNGDAKVDLALLTNQGAAGTNVVVLTSTGVGFSGPVLWSTLGVYGWAGLKPLAGDFTGDGRSDLAMVTDAGGAGSSVVVLPSLGSSFAGPTVWATLPGYGWGGIRAVSGTFNSDGRADIGLLTNLGPSGTGLVTLLSAGASFSGPFLWGTLPAYGWSGIKAVSGDYDVNGRTDLALVVDQGPGGSAVVVVPSSGTAFGGPSSWLSLPASGWSGIKVATSSPDS